MRLVLLCPSVYGMHSVPFDDVSKKIIFVEGIVNQYLGCSLYYSDSFSRVAKLIIKKLSPQQLKMCEYWTGYF